MKQNELRVGNWVLNNLGTPFKVQAKHIQFCNDMQPIPLTHEIFEKTSLIKDHVLFTADESVRMKSAKDVGVRYCSFFFNKRLDKWMDTQTRVTLTHLHELQNYYFIMTGEELEIKL